MNAKDSRPPPAGHSTSEGPRLHRVYFLLAAFDLITVSVSLLLVHVILGIYEDSVKTNEIWAELLGEYTELNRLALEVTQPGNNVFQSENIAREIDLFDRASKDFDDEFLRIEEKLTENASLHTDNYHAERLKKIKETMSELKAAESGIFKALSKDDERKAGRSMAEMDAHYVRLNEVLNELIKKVQSTQAESFEDQRREAERVGRYELLIGLLMIGMVTAVTFYGVTLARRMKETERQKEHHLAMISEKEARIRALVDGAEDAILTVGRGRTVETANPAAESMFERETKEIIGVPVDDLVARVAGPDAAKTDSQPARELALTTNGGRRLDVELRVSDVPFSDGSFQTWILRDVSDRKRAELEVDRYREHLETLVDERTAQLEASNQKLGMAERLASIGTLAAGLGHDMNNVLFPVRCHLESLDQLELETEVRRTLGAVSKSVAYLQQLSDGLRLLALDPDDDSVAGATTDLRVWWDEVAPLFRTSLPKHAMLDVDWPEDVPNLAVAPPRLTQAIFNLIVNAAEAIESDGCVRLTARSGSDNRFIELSVEDDGQGMTAEESRRALDPFFTTKKRGLSTGLGLALVHGMVQSVGGSLDIESEPGKGTSVKLTLPVAQTPSSDERRKDKVAIVSLSDPRIAAFVKSLLISAGCQADSPRTEGSDAEALPDADLWILEKGQAPPTRIDEFLASDGKRAIVIGQETSSHQRLEAIAEPTFEALREGIRRVLKTGAVDE